MKVYINYPNPHIKIHKQINCGFIHAHRSQNQRMLLVNINNLGEQLSKFIKNEIIFTSKAGLNGLWLDVRLENEDQDRSFVVIVQALLGIKYQPLARAEISQHC